MPPFITRRSTTGGGGGVTPSTFTQASDTYTTGPDAVFVFMQACITAGWIASKTNNGATYSSTGNVIATSADLTDPASSFVLTAPTGQQYLFYHSTPDDTYNWGVYPSASGFGFTGGAIDARPTNTDLTAINLEVGPFPPSGSFTMAIGIEVGGLYRWWLRSTPGVQDVDAFLVSAGLPANPLLLQSLNQGLVIAGIIPYTACFDAMPALLLGTVGV